MQSQSYKNNKLYSASSSTNLYGDWDWKSMKMLDDLIELDLEGNQVNISFLYLPFIKFEIYYLFDDFLLDGNI